MEKADKKISLPRKGIIWKKVKLEYAIKRINKFIKKIGLSLQIFLIFIIFLIITIFLSNKICVFVDGCPINYDIYHRIIWILEKFQDLFIGSFGIIAYITSRINEKRNQKALKEQDAFDRIVLATKQKKFLLKIIENYLDNIERFKKIVDTAIQQRKNDEKSFIKEEAFNLIPIKPSMTNLKDIRFINYEEFSSLIDIEACLDTIEFLIKSLKLKKSENGYEIVDVLWKELDSKLSQIKLLMILNRAEIVIDEQNPDLKSFMYLEFFKQFAETEIGEKLVFVVYMKK